MRKELFTIGDYVHVYNRGNRKQEIVREVSDKWHFLQMLYYFNNSISISNPFKNLRKKLESDFDHKLVWPAEWPLRKPLVKILVFSLMENHFHIILKEIIKGGTALFMQKLGTGMTSYFNLKYQEKGRLFQSSYKAKVVNKDEYLQYLSVYIQLKNPLELYPKRFRLGLKKFNDVFEWVIRYPYCSLADYANRRNSPIIDKDILGKMFQSPEKYKNFAKDCILSINFKESLEALAIED